MKKLLLSFLSIPFLFSCVGFAQDWDKDFYYGDTPVATDVNSVSDTEDIGQIMAEGTVKGDKTLLNEFLSLFGFGGSEYTGTLKALIYIKSIINLLLGLVSFIALVIIIYSFYLMFFSEDSKGIEQVKKNLKGVAIALVILGLSRIIISFIFDFYQTKLLNG